MPFARWLACCATLCVLLLSAAEGQAQPKPGGAPAAVDDQEARDLFRLGKQAFDEGRYERALKYFKDAYDLSGRAALQFNIGTVLDRLRRDREAVDAYRSYLSQTPEATNREVVEERIRVLEDALSKSKPAPALVTPPPSAAPATAPPTAATPAPVVPTPAETARAAVAVDATADGTATGEAAPADTSTPITGRWWFWTGLGAVAIGAVVAGVALGSSSTRTLEGPALLGPATRVRPL